MSVKTFQDLIAWQKAMSLAEAIYAATSKMPTSEQFGLTNQMRRAAVSVPSNIAEGFGRQKTEDLLRFLRITRGSLMELHTQLILAIRLKFLPQSSVNDMLEETDRVLQGLIRSLENRKPRDQATKRHPDEPKP